MQATRRSDAKSMEKFPSSGILPTMADHYRKTVELLEDVDDLAVELLEAYKSHAGRETVGDIHAALSRALKKADIHAKLAIAQAMFEQGIRL